MDTNKEINTLRERVEELTEGIQKLSDKQNAHYTDIMLLLKSIEGKLQASEVGERSDEELYEAAKEAVINMQRASAAFLQRKFDIGYGRAAYLIDLLEKRGVIGTGDNVKPRKVLVQKEE